MPTRGYVENRASRRITPRWLVRTGIPLRQREQARRLLNLSVAAVGIVVTLPLTLLTAVAIKLTSRGPVLFGQARVGVDRRTVLAMGEDRRRHRNAGGRPFTIYKFRTMRVGSDGAQVWARPDDARVTPVGRLLRKYRVDELPQLYNVLRGDMNVVGPRPEQPQIVLHLREQVPKYAHRQRVLPGITGWAQINNSYDQTLDDVQRKVALDLEYIQRRSAVEDMKIMLRTLPVMLGRRGGW